MSEYVAFTTPVGRMLGGSLYKPQDKDASGKPLLIKSGPNVGNPTVRYWIPVGIPKGAEAHWKDTPWGAVIWAQGFAAFPQRASMPTFAWKIIDGDSTTLNQGNPPRRPCDIEGYPGHWVLNFGSTYAPKVYNNNGTEILKQVDAIKPGYWVQVAGTVAGNKDDSKSGVYLNPQIVSLQGYGAEIVSGLDPTAVGFGAAPLPAGLSATPVSALPPGGLLPAGAASAPAPTRAPSLTLAPAPAPAPIQVLPNPAFLNPPPAAPVAPAAPVRQMTALAQGHTYEALCASGWTDETLRAQGLMR